MQIQGEAWNGEFSLIVLDKKRRGARMAAGATYRRVFTHNQLNEEGREKRH